MTLDTNALPRGVVTNAVHILGAPEAIHQVDPNHFLVASLRHPGQRLRVYKNGERWRCQSDRHSDQDTPCAHILAVLAHLGTIQLPSRNPQPASPQAELEERAQQLLPTRLPELLAQLLTANPGETETYTGYGRPPRPLYPQAYQALIRAAFQHSIRGSKEAANDRRHNPWGSVSRATLARFLAAPHRAAYLEALADATMAPARAYEGRGSQAVLRFKAPGSTTFDLEVVASPRYRLFSLVAVTDEPAPIGAPEPHPGAGRVSLASFSVASSSPVAQRNEALCFVVAHNLARLVLLELAEGAQVQFHRQPPPRAAGSTPPMREAGTVVSGAPSAPAQQSSPGSTASAGESEGAWPVASPPPPPGESPALPASTEAPYPFVASPEARRKAGAGEAGTASAEAPL